MPKPIKFEDDAPTPATPMPAATPSPSEAVPIDEMIRRWRNRRHEILDLLNTVCPDLIGEYRRLGTMLSAMKIEEVRAAFERKNASDTPVVSHIGPARGKTSIGKDIRERLALDAAERAKHAQVVIGPDGVMVDPHNSATSAVPLGPPQNVKLELTPRIPLHEQKAKLIAFMQTIGRPVNRAMIMSNTGIPAGSLSALLSEKEFEQFEHGFWGLKGQKKK
jgi:hypothetical protein